MLNGGCINGAEYHLCILCFIEDKRLHGQCLWENINGKVFFFIGELLLIKVSEPGVL